MKFTEDELAAGRLAAQMHGHLLSSRDVEDVVYALLTDGREIVSVDQVISQFYMEQAMIDVLEHVRKDMRRKLAIAVLEQGTVMLELPTETIEPVAYGDTLVRLTVPVRRIHGRTDS